jgi:hypothetical protein
MRFFFSLLLILALPRMGFAYSDSYFSVGLGVLQRDSFRLLNKDQGIEKPKEENNYPLLHLQYTFSAYDLVWAPELIYMPLKRKSQDGGTESSYLGLRVPVKNELTYDSFWTYGFSYFRYTIEGKGGVIYLDNLGSSQLFDLPASTVTSQFLTLDLSYGYNWDQWTAEAILLSEKILSNTKRSFSLMVEFKYNWRN